MKHLIRIRAFLKPYLWQTLATLITLLILTGLSLLVPRILSSVIDNGLKGGAPYLAWAALLLLGIGLFSALLNLINRYLSEWIAAHVHAFCFFGGASALLVPDNLRSGVSAAHPYEPEPNRTYEECARHYGCAILPTRIRRPKDKAKVEKGVQDVERRLLAPLRHHTFFSLAELNEALSRLLVQYNDQPFQKLPGTRRSLFEQLDQPALLPLPKQPYEYAEWKNARVNIDYHVAVDGRYYSVPYQLVNQQVEVRLTITAVECFHKNKRVASHLRAPRPGQYTTLTAHMPKAHQDYVQWTPERLVHWARKTGPETARVVETILISRPHPQQGFRACLGLMRLGKEYGDDRLEAACGRALAPGAVGFKSI